SSSHSSPRLLTAFGKWGLVCDDSWDLPDGDVVCRQLGFALGAKEVFTGGRFGTGEESSSFLMDDVNCLGHEVSLDHCNFAGWNEHDCSNKETAGVSCFNPGDECGRGQFRCQNGRCVEFRFLCDSIDDCLDSSDEEREMCESPVEVRLVGGKEDPSEEPRSGRVEVKYLGQWGTVCDDDFGIEEGHVFCRMLGWGSAKLVHKNNTFGEGEGQIWLDDLRCLGYETSVVECTHQLWGVTNCDHSEDVGLTCSPELLPELDGSGPMVSTSRPPPSSLPQHCGFRTVSDRPKPPPLEAPRIVKGYVPQPGAHPWMAGLRLRTTTGSSHWCGGVIVTAEHIMTAAHCVNRYPSSTYIIRVGDFDNAEVEPEEQEFRVHDIRVHLDFAKGLDLNNDIAIIKLKPLKGKHIRFSSLVQPICLPLPDFNYKPGMQCSVAGWGSMGRHVGYSRLMQSTFLPILSDKQCRTDHVYGPNRLSDTMFCAGRLEGGVDTCQGDSGGPLVCEVNGRHTTVGITSWGQGCARANKPGVYTRITNYLDWIYDNLY
ncbi:neurotrypsin-like, partial [Oratosquilla oratoria]|uniref:neurotrypsin-like n=1 Tax=Oratosquilla oratoria TaxID=337810 RepID=UPI003F767AD6